MKIRLLCKGIMLNRCSLASSISWKARNISMPVFSRWVCTRYSHGVMAATNTFLPIFSAVVLRLYVLWYLLKGRRTLVGTYVVCGVAWLCAWMPYLPSIHPYHTIIRLQNILPKSQLSPNLLFLLSSPMCRHTFTQQSNLHLNFTTYYNRANHVPWK